MNLHRFLILNMECDFQSACFFDFDNLDAQLQFMAEYSHDIREGLDSLKSRHGLRQVVYEDLIQKLWTSSYPGDPDSFLGLVEVVRGIARKIYDEFTGTAGIQAEHPTPSPAMMGISQIEDLVSSGRIILSELEQGDEVAWRATRQGEASLEETKTFMQGLKE